MVGTGGCLLQIPLYPSYPVHFCEKVPLTYWGKTFHISGFHIPSLLTMLRALRPKNSRSSAKREGSSTWLGVPYHPSTNGAAERLVQTFKQTLRKSAQLPKKALLDFLRQYRRTPTDSGFSPSQLLNGRQIRTKLDAILPSPARIMQGKQTRAISSNDDSRHPIHNFKAGDPCYALYFGPKQTKDPRWVPAVVVKWTGTRTIQVRTVPKVASGDVTLINFDHDILHPKMMNQARTTTLTLTTPQILNKFCTWFFLLQLLIWYCTIVTCKRSSMFFQQDEKVNFIQHVQVEPKSCCVLLDIKICAYKGTRSSQFYCIC